MISIEDLERAAVPGWRGTEEEPLGDWLLRAAEGFTGRANSALAVGHSGWPAATTAGYVRDWYRARGLPAMIAVPYPTREPHRNELDAELAALGWTTRPGPATVMIATAAGISRDPPRGEIACGEVACGEVARGEVARGEFDRVEIGAEPDAAWLARYHYRGGKLPAVARRVLMSAPWQVFASVRQDGRTIAIGRAAGTGDWAGLTAIEVDPGHRRRGLGAAVTAALAGAAARRGMHKIYLQVEDDNTVARALYAKMGFRDHHGYHYRVAPTSS